MAMLLLPHSPSSAYRSISLELKAAKWEIPLSANLMN